MNPGYPFKQIQVSPSPFAGDVVTWSLDPVFADTAPFTFTMEVAETPDFSELISRVVSTDGYSAKDNSRKRQTTHFSYFYRVRLDTGSGKSYYSNLTTLQQYSAEYFRYLNAKEMIRREYVRLRYAGIAGYLLKRKNYGEIVKSSVSSVSGIPMVESAPTYGTRYAGGYYAPLAIQFSIEDSKEVSKSNDSGLGTDDISMLGCRTPGFPILHIKDVLVFRNNRYNIEAIQYKDYPGTSITVVQTFEARSLAPGDPVYKIPVPDI